jgi:hypothetical protein
MMLATMLARSASRSATRVDCVLVNIRDGVLLARVR